MNIERAKTTVRSVQNASHHELSSLLAQVSALVNRSGCLSDSCRRMSVDEMDELAGRIDADLVEQQQETQFDNRLRRAA